jgi:hypothetical protein
VNAVTGGADLTRGHEGNKQVSFWISQERFIQLEEFLDKFLAGGSFSEQFREFIVWTIKARYNSQDF